MYLYISGDIVVGIPARYDEDSKQIRVRRVQLSSFELCPKYAFDTPFIVLPTNFVRVCGPQFDLLLVVEQFYVRKLNLLQQDVGAALRIREFCHGDCLLEPIRGFDLQ